MARELTEVGVVGLGTMGAGIAEVFSRAGLSVTAVEVGDEALQRGREHVENSPGRAVARGRLDPAERDAVLGRSRFTTRMADLADAELVVEAVRERPEVREPGLAPAPLLWHQVTAGRLGRTTGRGFRDHPAR